MTYLTALDLETGGAARRLARENRAGPNDDPALVAIHKNC
jgi:hypothetical protein